MKQLSAQAYGRYGRVLKALRAKGVRLGFLEMSKAAELAGTLGLKREVVR